MGLLETLGAGVLIVIGVGIGLSVAWLLACVVTVLVDLVRSG